VLGAVYKEPLKEPHSATLIAVPPAVQPVRFKVAPKVGLFGSLLTTAAGTVVNPRGSV